MTNIPNQVGTKELADLLQDKQNARWEKQGAIAASEAESLIMFLEEALELAPNVGLMAGDYYITSIRLLLEQIKSHFPD